MRTKSEILKDMPLPLFLMKCRTDFKFFCEECLGSTSNGDKIEMQPFQMKWFYEAEKNRKLIIESGTRSGKTEVMGAMYPVWKMFCNKNLRILLLSKSLEQSSSNLLSRIKKYIEENELLMETFRPEDYRASWNASEIKTKHGCWVKNMAYNDRIRGFGGDIIIPDEIDSYEDPNIFFEHVLSRMSPKAQLIGISTPVGATRIIGLLKEKHKAGILKGWHFIKTPYLVDDEGNPAKIESREDIWKYNSIWESVWSKQLLYERWEQGKANWLRNHMCEDVGEVDDAIFPMKDVLSSFDYKLGFSQVVNPESMYFIGVDLAISEGPRADLDAYVVVEKTNGQYIIRWIETHKGLDTTPKITRLKELYDIYYSDMGTFMSVDKSQIGIDVIRGLQAKGIPVKEGSFHSAGRKQLYRTLSNVLASKKLVIPRNPDSDDECVKYSEELREQMSGFKRSKSQKTGAEMIESKSAHDDICCHPDSNIQTEEGLRKIKEIKVGDKVLTHNGRYRKVLAVSKRISKNIATIKGVGKLPIQITTNHPLYVFNKKIDTKSGKNTIIYNNPHWRSIDEIEGMNKYGLSFIAPKTIKDIEKIDLMNYAPKSYISEEDYLISIVKNFIRPDGFVNPKSNKIKRYMELDENMCTILGYFAAEGTSGKHNVSFASHKKEKIFRDFVKSQFVGMNFCEKTRDNGTNLSFGNVVYNQFFKDFGYKDKKRLPKEVIFLPINKQKRILEGWAMGDGNFSSGRFSGVTISRELANQLYIMFVRCGLKPTIDYCSSKRQWALRMGKPETEKFMKFIRPEFLEQKLRDVKKGEQSTVDQTVIKYHKEYLIGSIREIDIKEYNGEVYNLEVEEDNSYIIENTIVHNCASLALAISEAVEHEEMELTPLFA